MDNYNQCSVKGCEKFPKHFGKYNPTNYTHTNGSSTVYEVSWPAANSTREELIMTMNDSDFRTEKIFCISAELHKSLRRPSN